MTENKEKVPSTQRIDELIQGIEALSDADRSLLIERLIGIPIVVINDWLGSNQQRPCATILYSRGKWKSIDILASVRKNAASIGHPAILIAIKRWEQAVLTQYPLSRSQRRQTETAMWQAAQGSFGNIAKQHLKNIGNALLEAAEDPERRISNLTLFNAILEPLNKTADTYLKLIWRVLAEDEVHYKQYGTSVEGVQRKIERSYEDKLRVLKRRVVNRFAEYGFEEERLDPSPLDGPVRAREAFLQNIESLFSSVFKFLSCNESRCFFDKHPTWAVMRNSYIKWRTGRSINTTKNYRSRIQKQTGEPAKVDFRNLVPDSLGNNRYYADTPDAFSLPTTPCTLTTCSCRERERKR